MAWFRREKGANYFLERVFAPLVPGLKNRPSAENSVSTQTPIVFNSL